MTTATQTPDVRRLKKVVKADPYDLDARLALADAMEEAGDGEALCQRLLVAFCRLVHDRVNSRGTPGLRVIVGVEDGPVNARVFIEQLWRDVAQGQGQRTVYAFVQKFDVPPGHVGDVVAGPVTRGSWKKPEGPTRFYLTDGAETWAKHCDPYGLRYLR